MLVPTRTLINFRNAITLLHSRQRSHLITVKGCCRCFLQQQLPWPTPGYHNGSVVRDHFAVRSSPAGPGLLFTFVITLVLLGCVRVFNLCTPALRYTSERIGSHPVKSLPLSSAVLRLQYYATIHLLAQGTGLWFFVIICNNLFPCKVTLYPVMEEQKTPHALLWTSPVTLSRLLSQSSFPSQLKLIKTSLRWPSLCTIAMKHAAPVVHHTDRLHPLESKLMLMEHAKGSYACMQLF